MNGGIHNGADWPVNDGTQVHTILGGEVAWADFTAPDAGGQWGGLVVIENGAYQVWYAHMQEIFVTKGQIVQWGDVVGLSDNLGNSTGPHLHLGVKRKSDQCWISPLNFIDPDLYIVGGCG
jgi:murein DD-endopeptidase MepM/ murein hydrolase activator NlpD